MINIVDELLAGTLRKEFGQAFAPVEMPEIAFSHPSTVEAKAPTVSLYLYDVRENAGLRGDPFTIARQPDGKTATRVRSTLYFNLTYAVSGHAPDPKAQHALLTFALGTFLRNPRVEMPSQEGEEPQALNLSIAQTDHETFPALPNAHPVPSVTLCVTAPFNPYDIRTVPLVREALFGIGQGTEPGFLGHPVDTQAIRLSATGQTTHEVLDRETKELRLVPLPNVLVSVVGGLTRASTDDEGIYLLLNLPAGPHTLRFERRGYEPEERVVEVPASGRVHEVRPTDVVLRALDHERALAEARDFAGLFQSDLVRRTNVVGRLRYPDGMPAAYLPVRWGTQSTVTDSQGVYSFSAVPSGTPLVADIPGHGPVEVSDGTAPAPPKEKKDPVSSASESTPQAPRRSPRKKEDE